MKSIIEHYQARPLGEERCYAVCLPLIWQEGRWQVLYEIRSQHISHVLTPKSWTRHISERI
ncbi:phosphohydrolase MutT/nudix family protein [Streptococcus equi subsp. zooepidemicus]|uniref:Phosphohydrolase MutT/nudix family protein n=1 Tax=Streptococcus equi subsp. zooepidemicus TaxID=40041 RepID=A0A7Z9D2M4_STRSZ|nr:phosphohydrolase MutT/nudix family protein [Streptococcus equi subsp. zooepidemicus]VTS40809.1 phosphohydrolase MutT/nudix family protein [Streptococcus equi subsp. zooepidemicus]